MATLLYSPGVKVYIETEKHGTLDVSDDLVDGTMVRRSDGVSSFNFTLQNARRKYDGVFAPNDRIFVTMKRITWMPVFTGYLNSVPLVTAWPRVVPLAASCSLKRLQYWYWDAGLPATQTMVANALQAVKTADDGGIANVILTILKEVVGWPESKVHIAGIPSNWFDLAYKIAKDVDARAEEADEIAQQFYSTLQGQGIIGGVPADNLGGSGGGTVWQGTMKPGTYGGEPITKAMCVYVEKIWNNGKHMGASNRDIAIGMMTAYQESSMGANKTAMTQPNQYGCIGLFQQTIKGFRPGWGPNEGWGTKAELLNPDIQCRNFFNRLLKLKNRTKMTMAQAAEAVQVSGNPQGFAKHERLANAIVTFLGNASSGKKPSTNPSDNKGSWGSGKSTGKSLTNVAVDLVRNNKKIIYTQQNTDPPSTPAPQVRRMDCSSFVQWTVYHTLGSTKGLPRVTWDQISWLKAKGKRVSSKQAARTAGALLYSDSGGHVEISIGDGVHVVGAHNSKENVGVKKYSKGFIESYYTQCFLFPGLSYDVGGGGSVDVPDSGEGGGGDPGSAVQTAPLIDIGENKDQPWYNPDDKFDQLFGDNPWVPTFNDQEAKYAVQFTGIRALLNDQPMLPYLKNLFNSTMRSFCSAPNGDLIGWFPDYYGIWGTAASMIIEPIEIKDFSVEWSDDFFVTHQYTTQTVGTNTVDLASGLSSPLYVLNAAVSAGIATIDIPSIMYSLFGLEPDKASAQKFINWIYKRFGARPDFQQLPGVVGSKGEFFAALFLFMRQWAYQYNAEIPLTFMPELWPGMLIKIPEFDFQAYVTTVTHSFSFGKNGGFSTAVNIAAPARLPTSVNDRDHVLIGLPMAGGLDPRDRGK